MKKKLFLISLLACCTTALANENINNVIDSDRDKQ